MHDCIHQQIFDKRVYKVNEIITCPRCGFQFRLMYGRAFACVGCRFQVMGCDKARCPKCDTEFPLSQTNLPTDHISGDDIATYISDILKTYHHDFGVKPSR